MTKLRRVTALSLTALLALGGAACGDDEDGDGAELDEEVDEVDERSEDVRDDAEEEADEAEDEVED